MRVVVLLFSWLITAALADGQELSYHRFTVKDGLPGSIVYHCLQDAKGFIWFATDQGVSRFDGRNFRNYTREDGLPDNDILKLYLDRFDNVWFLSFIGIPSVLYHDSIISFNNCRGVRSICEDTRNDCIQLMMADELSGTNGCYRGPDHPGRWKFSPDITSMNVAYPHPLLRVSTPGNTDFFLSGRGVAAGETLKVKEGGVTASFLFNRNDKEFSPFARQWGCSVLSNGRSIVFLAVDSAYYSDIGRLSPLFSLRSLVSRQNLTIPEVNDVFGEDDSTLWICTRNYGLLRVRNFLDSRHTVDEFFPGHFCTSMIRDREGGYWVTTYSDGVFYCPNLCFRAVSSPHDLNFASVRSLRLMDTTHIVAGFDNGNIMVFDRHSLRHRVFPRWAISNRNNRIMDLAPLGRHSLVVAADRGLYRLSFADTEARLRPGAFKELFVRSDDSLLAANAEGAMLLDTTGRLLRPILSPRATCLAGFGDLLYWGGHAGIHVFQQGRSRLFGEQYPGLTGVINHIDIAPDSAIWISTEEGLMIWKAGAMHHIGKEQQLISNLCKQVSFHGTTAWVATDKGISRLDYHWQDTGLHYSAFSITEEDGLRADNVNRIVIAGGTVWAATTRGISSFPEDYTGRSTLRPGINITRIAVDDEPLALKDSAAVTYRSGKLLVELAGISFRSGGHVAYEYRLTGIDNNWNSLTGNTIDIHALPFGRFVLQARAIDRWGARSLPISIMILHPSPFYRSAWFIVSFYLFFTLLTAAGLYMFNRHRQRKKDKEFRLRKKMHELEIAALRAQINPHFIFNCLTSIQYHILRADVLSANAYLHKFSNLIRLTLQCSTLPIVSLEEEIRMLTLYLELEKLRLGDRMNYRLVLPPNFNPEGLSFPSMIVQPYVENAIQHGIAPLEGRIGELAIEFTLTAGYLCCTVEDNGPGIGRNRLRQTDRTHIPLGTSLTSRRLGIINSINKQKIHLEIIDKSLAGSAGSGTIVHLRFPLKTDYSCL